MAENKPIIEKPITIHAYRGIREVHSWSHYKKLDTGWSVCGYDRHLKGGFPDVDSTDSVALHRGTTDVSRVDCIFCLDLIEGTHKRQAAVKNLPTKLRNPRRAAIRVGTSDDSDEDE